MFCRLIEVSRPIGYVGDRFCRQIGLEADRYCSDRFRPENFRPDRFRGQ